MVRRALDKKRRQQAVGKDLGNAWTEGWHSIGERCSVSSKALVAIGCGGVLFRFYFKPDDIVCGVVLWYIACEVRAISGATYLYI